MMKPKAHDLISIIVPVYNIEEYVSACLSSVCCQSYENLEIIVVDDGSCDGSSEICRRFANTDTRIKYVRQENRGLVRARKTGLCHAKGKYVVFVDGDDTIDEIQVMRLYEEIMEHGVDFVRFNYKISGKNQKFFQKKYLYSSELLTDSLRKNIISEYIFQWERYKEIFECHVYASIYRRELISYCFAMVPDTQSYGEDLICFIHLMMNCDSLLMLPEAHYNYTVRNGSLDHPTVLLKSLGDKLKLYEEVKNVLSMYRLDGNVHLCLQEFFIAKILSDIYLDQKRNAVNTFMSYSFKGIEGLLGKKVILYGCGTVGRSYYAQLRLYDSIDIVAWVDKNYENTNNIYRRIDSPLRLTEIEYDVILIAVYEETSACDIKNWLTITGVDSSKILWKQPNTNYKVDVLYD